MSYSSDKKLEYEHGDPRMSSWDILAIIVFSLASAITIYALAYKYGWLGIIPSVSPRLYSPWLLVVLWLATFWVCRRASDTSDKRAPREWEEDEDRSDDGNVPEMGTYISGLLVLIVVILGIMAMWK